MDLNTGDLNSPPKENAGFSFFCADWPNEKPLDTGCGMSASHEEEPNIGGAAANPDPAGRGGAAPNPGPAGRDDAAANPGPAGRGGAAANSDSAGRGGAATNPEYVNFSATEPNADPPEKRAACFNAAFFFKSFKDDDSFFKALSGVRDEGAFIACRSSCIVSLDSNKSISA